MGVPSALSRHPQVFSVALDAPDTPVTTPVGKGQVTNTWTVAQSWHVSIRGYFSLAAHHFPYKIRKDSDTYLQPPQLTIQLLS
jgi:hypothetical protein